ncbi:unnamed protein product [Vitrella brassicaformis CCMP3155]|uniref:Uncharacterized protein n=3 Tax=Vitrella brassicaformis TaxID=1169539 RepID=A0A0G4F3M6_VITBC|nr:unnamed protein product [Vitrella brassicaformis CCMP3155]|eukprot:CEM06430.1 unnamed protein product [Vitrella brassicaformis CCMP3155]
MLSSRSSSALASEERPDRRQRDHHDGRGRHKRRHRAPSRQSSSSESSSYPSSSSSSESLSSESSEDRRKRKRERGRSHRSAKGGRRRVYDAVSPSSSDEHRHRMKKHRSRSRIKSRRKAESSPSSSSSDQHERHRRKKSRHHKKRSSHHGSSDRRHVSPISEPTPEASDSGPGHLTHHPHEKRGGCGGASASVDGMSVAAHRHHGRGPPSSAASTDGRHVHHGAAAPILPQKALHAPDDGTYPGGYARLKGDAVSIMVREGKSLDVSYAQFLAGRKAGKAAGATHQPVAHETVAHPQSLWPPQPLPHQPPAAKVRVRPFHMSRDPPKRFEFSKRPGRFLAIGRVSYLSPPGGCPSSGSGTPQTPQTPSSTPKSGSPGPPPTRSPLDYRPNPMVRKKDRGILSLAPHPNGTKQRPSRSRSRSRSPLDRSRERSPSPISPSDGGQRHANRPVTEEERREGEREGERENERAASRFTIVRQEEDMEVVEEGGKRGDDGAQQQQQGGTPVAVPDEVTPSTNTQPSASERQLPPANVTAIVIDDNSDQDQDPHKTEEQPPLPPPIPAAPPPALSSSQAPSDDPTPSTQPQPPTVVRLSPLTKRQLSPITAKPSFGDSVPAVDAAGDGMIKEEPQKTESDVKEKAVEQQTGEDRAASGGEMEVVEIEEPATDARGATGPPAREEPTAPIDLQNPTENIEVAVSAHDPSVAYQPTAPAPPAPPPLVETAAAVTEDPAIESLEPLVCLDTWKGSPVLPEYAGGFGEFAVLEGQGIGRQTLQVLGKGKGDEWEGALQRREARYKREIAAAQRRAMWVTLVARNWLT